MLPHHSRQYTPSFVPNPSLDPDALNILIHPCVDVRDGGDSGSGGGFLSSLFSMNSFTLLISDRQTDKMDGRLHVRALVELVALLGLISLYHSLAILALVVASLDKRRKQKVGLLPSYQTPILAQAQAVLYATIAR